MARNESFIIDPGDVAELRFNSAEPREDTFDGRYGKTTYYYYDVDDNRGELKTTEYLHNLLQQAEGFGDGALVEISRVNKGGKTAWGINVLEDGDEREPVAAKSRGRSASRSNGNGNGRSRSRDDDGESPRRGRMQNARRAASGDSRNGDSREPDRVFQDIVNDYYACIVAARELAVELPNQPVSNDDVRSIATVLYIQSDKAGIAIPQEEGALDPKE